MQNVLVLDPQDTLAPQLKPLPGDRFAFHRVPTVAAARELLRKRRCNVGLASFEALPRIARDELECLLGEFAAVEWIAAVTAEAIADPDCRRLVLGAFHDYHTLPVDPQRLAITLGHAEGKARLRQSTGRLDGETGRFGMYGNSPAMRHFYGLLEKVVRADLPVLIGGESGTGKELVAQAIHQHSRRAGGPMVVVNCGAIPPSLIQSELFGHEKGAFTGALQRKIGSIESADGGVLFLDEIGDLPLDLQANLLRVLQERAIVRLGSMQKVPVDFRIVAATHVDLREAVNAGRFRQDLYFRLNVVHLQLPPLRDRGGDVLLIAEAVLRDYAAANRDCRVSGFASRAMRAMGSYRWPGNVRELINRVQRALVMSDKRLLDADDLGLEDYADDRECVRLDDARASFERDLIETSLRANGNNVSKAARQLGVSRVTLYRILNRPQPGRYRS